MPNERTRRVETLFHAALERAAGAERLAYLDGACGADGDLRARVDGLLAAHVEATGFLEGPAVEGGREGPGSAIGPYKLLQEIGEGGMGVVYMAEQLKPVRRKVAVKVIKLGMDTKQVIARFEAERQALAMMDHANIARVLDAGATEAGRPYFVMELVRGVPIDEYCDTHNLPTAERLRLFIDVCRAVQHAHQKGIIHRDLKPTNVLVTSHDGTPVPKIIDFGVAKATHQNLTERTLFTEYRQIIGTPEYMSPEQAEMSGLDVDTRSDIYALGVLLYQLLTGTTPVDPQALRTAGFEEMTRIIREDEAPAPSTRISKLGADAEQIARRRGSDAGSLSRRFRGDLDWIVMKALEKDRTRRYDTASAFAEDVVRHLEDRPVVAGPPRATYRLAKFAHRNRRAVAAALVLAAVVGLGLAGTTAGFLRARAEANRSRAIGDSLQDVLAMSDPARAGERGEVEEVLATTRALFGADHATFAAVLDTLARQLHDAGDFEAAADLCRESLEVWRRAYGERHPNVAVALARLGSSLRALGADGEAETALRSALSILAQTPGATELAGYDVRFELADLLANRGEYGEADALLGEALALLRASPSPPRFKILQALEQRTVVALNLPSTDPCEIVREMYDEALAFYPDGSPMLAVYELALGRTLFERGDHAAAEPRLREAIRRFRASPRPSRHYLVLATDRLFQILRRRDDPESVRAADEVLAELLELGHGFWAPDELATNLRYYAQRMQERGRLDEALRAGGEAYGILADAGRPAEGRDGLREDLVELALHLVQRPDGPAADCDAARTTMERVLRDDPGNPAASLALGAAVYRQGDVERAAEVLDPLPEALGEEPDGEAEELAAVLHYFRALTHARLGDEDAARAAVAALRTSLARDPAVPRARALLAEVEELVEENQPPSEDG